MEIPDYSPYKKLPVDNYKFKKKNKGLIIFLVLILVITIIYFGSTTATYVQKELISPSELTKCIPPGSIPLMNSDSEIELFGEKVNAEIVVIDSGNDLEAYAHITNIKRTAIFDMLREKI